MASLAAALAAAQRDASEAQTVLLEARQRLCPALPRVVRASPPLSSEPSPSYVAEKRAVSIGGFLPSSDHDVSLSVRRTQSETASRWHVTRPLVKQMSSTRFWESSARMSSFLSLHRGLLWRDSARCLVSVPWPLVLTPFVVCEALILLAAAGVVAAYPKGMGDVHHIIEEHVCSLPARKFPPTHSHPPTSTCKHLAR